MAPSGWCQRFSLACRCSSQYPSSPGFLCSFARGLGCATLLCLWLCTHLLSGLGSPMLPDCPLPWFQWLFFSTGVPYLRDGSPLRGRGLFVLDRNEGVVSPFRSGPLVSSWLDLKPLSAVSLRTLSLRVCCRVVLHMSVSFGCP